MAFKGKFKIYFKKKNSFVIKPDICMPRIKSLRGRGRKRKREVEIEREKE